MIDGLVALCVGLLFTILLSLFVWWIDAAIPGTTTVTTTSIVRT